MTQIILPHWLRDELDQAVGRQVKLARALQARLVDHDRNLSPRTEVKTLARDVVEAVKLIDQLNGRLAKLAGGSKAYRRTQQEMAHTLEFAAYSERSLKHAERKVG